MPSPILASTLQSALLGVVSNLVAQVINARQNQIHADIDWVQVFQFILFTVISTPPNVLWQEFLETTFPAHPAEKTKPKTNSKPNGFSSTNNSEGSRLSYRNTAAKMLLDQTLGASVNILLFSFFIRSIRAATTHAPQGLGLHKTALWWMAPNAIDLRAVDFDLVWDASVAELWPFLTAGWKFWPIISFISFTTIKSVQMRNLFGAVAGIAWNVYLCIMTAE